MRLLLREACQRETPQARSLRGGYRTARGKRMPAQKSTTNFNRAFFINIYKFGTELNGLYYMYALTLSNRALEVS
ncbi:hypothetical protein FS935_22115 [Metabacillus litoralis]|uniref:Uncharacterized protein n=1 Tax=Metabacillus litoralis TaxID=152268 RepID=A0A5C6V8E2_9BACI|nr:hypothetical protein FS935_22115 [Metabacillus litoralis]